MSVLNHLKELFDHMYWADAMVWNVILKIPETMKNDKLKKIIYHYHTTQYAFYYIWMSLPMEFPRLKEFKSMAEISNWASEYPDLVKKFISGLKEEDLNKTVHIPWAERLVETLGKKPVDSILAEQMLQVTAHSSYHRGQVNSLIRESGGEPPLVDFIAWVWLGKPPAGSFFPRGTGFTS
jgi:uncharacterized damage-inducible protein DinB